MGGPVKRTGGTSPPARVVGLAFLAVVMGGQLATPLLPEYGRDLGLDVANLSVAYSVFLVALVPVLLAMTIPRLQSRPVLLLLLSLLAAMAADVFYLTVSLPGLLVGRALSGFALGLGAGAAAALTLALVGERGRTVVATVTIIGALSGSGGAVLVAEFLPAPLLTGFGVHLLLTVAVVVAAAIGLRPSRIRYIRVDAAAPAPDSAEASGPPLWVGYLLGSIAFTVGGLVVALVPLSAAIAFESTSLILANAAAISMLVVANIAQYSLASASMRWATLISALSIAAGVLITALGLTMAVLPLVIAGCGMTGIGQGLGYRTGMRIVMAGLDPRQQGVRTSVYSCVSYGACAVLVFGSGLVVGSLGNILGMWTVMSALVVPAAVLCISAGLRRATPQSRNSSLPVRAQTD